MSKPLETYIDPTAKIGFPLRPLQGFIESKWKAPLDSPQFGSPVYIGPNAIIGEAVVLGDRVIVDAGCTVGRGARVGDDTLLIYAADLGGECHIGVDCVIGGRISEGCSVGARSKVFGQVIHKHEDSSISWDHHETPEPAVMVLEDSFVGFNAILAGGIVIGPRAYVCAGAIVTKSVPAEHIAFGVNCVVHSQEWRGPLAENPMFNG